MGSKKTKNLIKKYRPRIESVVADTEEIHFSWRIFKIMGELVSGFEFLRRYGLAATFFGTARCQVKDKIYQQAVQLARGLAKMGFAIITGGGPGIMEAANRGADEAGGISVGLNIQLPHEQRMNKYVKEPHAFNYFFVRKVMLSYASEIYVFFPGGFGTLDELFEILTLIQTKKICQIPVILVGRNYWRHLLEWMEKDVYADYQAIDQSDLELYKLVDSVDEAMSYVKKLIREGKLPDKEAPVEYSNDLHIKH